MSKREFLSAKEAAALLGVSLPTLYAYVSRGLLHSEPVVPGERRRRYRRSEVEGLMARHKARRDPGHAARTALDFGAPVLDSALTLIQDGGLYYRGHSVIALARTRTLEDIAELLWTGTLPAAGAAGRRFEPPLLPPSSWPRQLEGLHPLERFQVLLPLASHRDPQSYALTPTALLASGERILRLGAASALPQSQLPTLREALKTARVAQLLQAAWTPDRPWAERLFDSALVLCADHELNVSSFTARCVASAQSTLYDAVTAGLCALRGLRHGGGSQNVEIWLDGLRNAVPRVEAKSIRAVLARQLKQGSRLAGFGHTLYPEGDPRGKVLLKILAESPVDSQWRDLIPCIAEQVEALTGVLPNIDFALASLSRGLGLETGTALTLFGLARIVGWIGQACEQYPLQRLIRPRARYVGPTPRD